MEMAASRRFNLGDMMILVASIAFGLVALKITLPSLDGYDRLFQRMPGARAHIFLWIQIGLSYFVPFLVGLTPGVLLISLRQPRLPLRQVSLQPGMMACAVATTAIAIEAFWIVTVIWSGSRFIRGPEVFVGYAQQVSFTVVGGWVALLLTGQWRSERTWIDRSGRLIGLTWLAVTALSWGRYYLR